MTTIARERRDRLRALNERVKVQRRDRIWQRGFDEGVADKKVWNYLRPGAVRSDWCRCGRMDGRLSHWCAQMIIVDANYDEVMRRNLATRPTYQLRDYLQYYLSSDRIEMASVVADILIDRFRGKLWL